MKSLVIYDSMFGNTELLAKAIAEVCGAKTIRASEYDPTCLIGIDFLIIGSPTQAGQATVPLQKIMNSIPDLKNINVAAFDTRVGMKWVKIFGFASNKIAKKLQSVKGNLVVNPEGFLVKDKEGPLVGGEIERAKLWAESFAFK